jgi:bifunctional UDP-N-acetylglucosamine pyrophosphorylase / glucosamine-1-phosphate N-acetyltransferase
MRIVETNWESNASPLIQGDWSVVIPAAGKGTRLGVSMPKILYPVAGKPILDWLLNLFLPVMNGVVVLVVAPWSRDAVEQAARERTSRIRIAVQEVATGMGDAVEIGVREVTTEHTAVVWGDQVALRRSSVEAVLRIHEGPLRPAVTFPTVQRRSPYIHFEREAGGKIAALRQAREGDAMPAVGESDTGFFCFRTAVLRALLTESRQSGERGAGTGEFNLLPILVRAAKEYTVVTPSVVREEETVGINTAADAARVADFLRSEQYASVENSV